MLLMNNTAYIATNLNKALIFGKHNAEILDGIKGKRNVLDSYIFSQLKAINPEIKEISYNSDGDLATLVADEYAKQESLSMALEVMDTSLSDEYRSGIADLLDIQISNNPDLVAFIKNRLYSTALPELFDSTFLATIKQSHSKELAGFYKELKEKSNLFNCFYTEFIILLNLNSSEQEYIDSVLTDNGCYAAFTNALFHHSQKIYDEAVLMAIPAMQEMHIFTNKELFYEIQNKLNNIHQIVLNGYNLLSVIEDDDKYNTSDPIIQLIEKYFADKQNTHDKKLGKRGAFRIVKDYDGDIEKTVREMKEWLVKNDFNSKEFFNKFKSVADKQLRSGHPKHLCKTCCDLATIFIEKSQFEIPEKLLKYAGLLNSEDKYVYSQTAVLLHRQNYLAKALKQYDEAIKKFSKDTVAYSGRAEVLRDMGKLEEALKQYDETIKKFGDDAVAYNGRAEVLRDMGKSAIALKQYDETIKKFSNNAVAYSGRAEVLRDMGKSEQALEQYNEAINKFGGDVVSYTGRAEVLRDMGKSSEALEQYDETIKKFRDNVFAYTSRAEVLRDMGKSSEALKQYDETINKFSNDRVAYSGRAEVLRDMGELEQALEQYEKALHLFPFDDYSKRGKMQLLLENNRFVEFEKIVQKTNYKTEGDYVELHMYCIFLLKTGDWSLAEEKIKMGLKCPYRISKRYFQNTFTYLKILQKEFQRALEELNSFKIHSPAQSLLLIHANAESNNKPIAVEELHKIEGIKRPVIHDTLIYLSERYALNGFKKTGKSTTELDALIQEGEMKALLQY